VELVSAQTWFGGKFQREPKYFFMQNPVEPENFLAMLPEISLPPEQKQKWLETRTGAIVGEQPQKASLEDRRPCSNLHPAWRKTDGSQTWEFDIVGILMQG